MSPISELSAASIHFHATQGTYFDKTKWQSVNWFESLLRSIFGGIFMNTLETACMQRSWENVVKLEVLPDQIVETIEKEFTQSRDLDSPLNKVANSISKIYGRVLQGRVGNEFPMHFEIKENEKRRLFEIGNSGTVLSSGYGVLNFYRDKTRCYTNINDDLIDQGEVIARVMQISYFSREDKQTWDTPFNYHYALFEGHNRVPTFIVRREGDVDTFVVRDSITNQMMAIALWSKDHFQKWSVTLTKPRNDMSKLELFRDREDKLNFLIWVLLKHSQKHLGGERERPYVSCERYEKLALKPS